jgi:hypothetical protein
VTNPTIPSPASVRSRIQQGDEQDGAKLLAVCVQALTATHQMTTTVEIPQGISEAGIVWTVRQLAEAGYEITRYRGCQRDPANSLLIKC